MIKRTVFFSSPVHLSARDRQLVVRFRTQREETIPAEDLGFVVLENPQISLTQHAAQLLMEHNAAVVFCGRNYHPTGMLLNFDGNHVQTERFRAQISASAPLKKQLWQQCIRHKIGNQATVLDMAGRGGDALRYRVAQVKSGDSSNEEAKAAKLYWRLLFGEDFQRLRFGAPPNNMLNYGYAIVRAAMARAIAGSGLHPTLGIHHRNKYNSFCLADDLMEPYRTWVDWEVWQWHQRRPVPEELTTEHKAHLLQLLTADVLMGHKKRPFMLGLTETTASVARCFTGTAKKAVFGSLPYETHADQQI